MRLWIALLPVTLFLCPLNAGAEYRAFLLAITNATTKQSRFVTSTLDDIQYPGYLPLAPGETVAIQATWMCWGSQGDFLPICANPKAEPAPSASSAN
jgi:hypothetical protein